MSSHMGLEMRAFSVYFLAAWMFTMVYPSSLKFGRTASMRQQDCWWGIWRRRAQRSQIDLLSCHLRGSRVGIWWCWRIYHRVIARRFNNLELRVLCAAVGSKVNTACYNINRDWIDRCHCCCVRKCGRKCECVYIGHENLLWQDLQWVHAVVLYDDTVVAWIIVEREEIVYDVGAFASKFSLSCNQRTHGQWWLNCAWKISFHFPHRLKKENILTLKLDRTTKLSFELSNMAYLCVRW